MPFSGVGLLGFANEMLRYARYWEDLGNPDRAVAYHQAAAAYMLAAVQENERIARRYE